MPGTLQLDSCVRVWGLRDVRSVTELTRPQKAGKPEGGRASVRYPTLPPPFLRCWLPRCPVISAPSSASSGLYVLQLQSYALVACPLCEALAFLERLLDRSWDTPLYSGYDLIDQLLGLSVARRSAPAPLWKSLVMYCIAPSFAIAMRASLHNLRTPFNFLHRRKGSSVAASGSPLRRSPPPPRPSFIALCPNVIVRSCAVLPPNVR
ncbi:hypothetical protein BD414DRAFT_220680 [Trametes punicea]|nr:hypothetical protein BD414DRAFT_220680 [Trametes punicea]